MHLLWASFADMSFKELILCFSHTHQLGIFKGLQRGKGKSHNKLLLSITKPQQSTNMMLLQWHRISQLLLHILLLCWGTMPYERHSLV